jgi:hypothetical protein
MCISGNKHFSTINNTFYPTDVKENALFGYGLKKSRARTQYVNSAFLFKIPCSIQFLLLPLRHRLLAPCG